MLEEMNDLYQLTRDKQPLNLYRGRLPFIPLLKKKELSKVVIAKETPSDKGSKNVPTIIKRGKFEW